MCNNTIQSLAWTAVLPWYLHDHWDCCNDCSLCTGGQSLPLLKDKPFPPIFLQWPNNYIRTVSRDHQHKYIRTSLNLEFILHLWANGKGWLLKQRSDHYDNVQLLIHITFVAESFSQEFMLQWPRPYVTGTHPVPAECFSSVQAVVCSRLRWVNAAAWDCVGAGALMDCYSRWLWDHTGKRCLQGAKGRGQGVITALKWGFITLASLHFRLLLFALISIKWYKVVACCSHSRRKYRKIFHFQDYVKPNF